MVILNTLLGIVFLIIAIVATYFVVAFFGMAIPIHRKFQHQNNGIDIFLTSNGMHVDFVVPTQNALYDWSQIIGNSSYLKDLKNYTYLGLGWGDRDFFLKVDSWDSVPKKVGARALLLPTPSLMHVTGYDELPANKTVKKVSISKSQYLNLCNFIQNRFALNTDQQAELVLKVDHAKDDNYYEAHGAYHCFYTCNNWVNTGLKKIGVRTSLWSPMAKGILNQVDKIKKERIEK